MDDKIFIETSKGFKFFKNYENIKKIDISNTEILEESNSADINEDRDNSVLPKLNEKNNHEHIVEVKPNSSIKPLSSHSLSLRNIREI
jgi:hypothetical protein